MRNRLVFLYADSKFDVPRCKYAWKNSSSKWAAKDTKIICDYNFVATLKFTTVINCLNKNLTTQFSLYFEKKKDYHIEILSIDRTSNKEHFYG